MSFALTLRSTALLSLLCVVAPAVAGAAEPSAPPDRVEGPDGARFRGAVSAEGGAIVVPDAVTLGLAGVQAQLGVQINHLVGVYAVPQIDVVFGEVGGLHFAAAAVVDFTIIDEISVGVGPEIGVFAGIGGNANGVAAAGGELYGARLHLGFQPAWGRGEDDIRRKAFSIGLDVRFLAGAAGIARVDNTSASADASRFVLAPMLSIGYQAF